VKVYAADSTCCTPARHPHEDLRDILKSKRDVYRRHVDEKRSVNMKAGDSTCRTPARHRSKSQRDVQPIADRVAQHLEIISKNFRFSTRRIRILMGFIIYYLVLIMNPMGRILVH